MGFLPNKNKSTKETKEVKEDVKPKEEAKEEAKEESKEKANEEKHRFVVVAELPTQQVRESTSEDGTILHFVTIEEALTNFMNK